MSGWNFEQIARIQKALAQRGFDPGVIDGVWGRRTEGAVRNFQTSRGLESDGVVGPKTWASLFGSAPDMAPLDNPALVWFQEARRLIGVKEKLGPGSDDGILDWAGALGIPYKSDDIPWCGLFVAHCIGSTLSREALPNNPLGARNWLKFGAPCTPSLGAVLVFWRGKPTGWQGHVGFYAGEEPSGVLHVLGGNQSDKVSIVRIARDRLLGARWPATAPVGSGGAYKVAVGKSILSSKEQ
jgi:uncharacterized protein (TIGR02594 family)